MAPGRPLPAQRRAYDVPLGAARPGRHALTTRDWDAAADRLGQAAAAEGEPTRWFEELYSSARRDEIDTPWDRSDPYPPLVDLAPGLEQERGVGRAVVVGASVGADAEWLAARGWATTAFDVAPSAVAIARERHLGSAVDYRVADLLDLPDDLRGAFDLVVEIFTVQALLPAVRERASAGLRALLAPGGTLLAVQFVRGERPADEGPPWLLDEAEMRALAAGDVDLVSLEPRPHPLRPDGWPVWVAVLRRRELGTS